MLKLNRKLEYAFIALQHMKGKEPGQLSSAKELSDRYSIPFDVTARVLQAMAQKGILRVELGAHGGYQIIRDLRKISLFELMQVTLGPVEVARCLTHDGCEISSTCNVKSPVRLLESRLLDFYRELSLWELLRPSVSARADRTAVQTAGEDAAAQLEKFL